MTYNTFIKKQKTMCTEPRLQADTNCLATHAAQTEDVAGYLMIPYHREEIDEHASITSDDHVRLHGCLLKSLERFRVLRKSVGGGGLGQKQGGKMEEVECTSVWKGPSQNSDHSLTLLPMTYSKSGVSTNGARSLFIPYRCVGGGEGNYKMEEVFIN